ncbi:MAG: hypothetical protein J07HR59_01195 [Halorubrum sp. J07HR59]|nr:MAG: hypothetical protein J07HR59_01195 [Halorubrum sp. J07HR59]
MSKASEIIPDADSISRGPTILVGLAVVVAIAIVYVWRPVFHGVIYQLVYSPTLLITLLVSIAGVIFVFSGIGTEDGTSVSREAQISVLGSVVVAAVIIGAVYGLPAGMVEERTLAQDTMSDSVQVETFPDVNSENPRIVPKAVADVQTSGSVSYRQHRLGTSDIARTEDGRLAWSYAIQPGPFQVRLTGNQRGVLLSDMTAIENRETQAFDEKPFAIGQGMFFHRSADWNLKKGDFWTQYRDDPAEFVHDGEAYMVYPKTGHEWRLTPIPHTVPVWDGVGLIHQDGTIEHLSPAEAQESEILDGQRLYPVYNAQRRASSLEFRNGIINRLPVVGTFRGVVEPARLPAGAGNEQPFVIDLEGETMSYVMAMEPNGRNTRGLDEVWFFNAETGESQFFGTGDDTLLGPQRAMGIVRSEDTRTDWVAGSQSGQFQVVEPVPVVIDGELWWHSKVVPVDQTDVTRNVFVSASGGTAVELSKTTAVVEFMTGKNLESIDDADQVGTEPAEDNPDVAYFVVVTDENGDEIERIPVSQGEQVNIVPGNSTASGNTTATG